jgi:hypothetical protein
MFYCLEPTPVTRLVQWALKFTGVNYNLLLLVEYSHWGPWLGHPLTPRWSALLNTH